MPKRGVLILIEGLDRAGKSTQCSLVAEALQKKFGPTELWKFPDRETAVGQMINNYLTSSKNELSDEAIHLLFSANRWELAGKLTSKLLAGVNVVLDRYYYSGIAFTAAKHKSNMTLDWCASPDKGLPAPDMTFFLDVSESVAQSRGGYGQERYEKVEFQRAVRKIFYELAEPSWQVIVADDSVEMVSQQIWANVTKFMDSFDASSKISVFEGHVRA